MFTEADRALLSRPLHAFVATVPRPDALPAPRPVWFELTPEEDIELFSFASTPRAVRLRADPRMSVVVAAPVGEPEAWVAIDGDASLHDDGAFDLAERLAYRYWGADLSGHPGVLDEWRRTALVRIAIRPTAVSRSAG